MLFVLEMNVEKIREDFPILKKDIVYLDSACMTLRPKQVVDKVVEYYNEYPACAGRSIHKFGNKVNEEVNSARRLIKNFIGAKKESEIIFTKNTTESINLLANSFSGERVLLTDREHNSNLVTWQRFKQGILRSNLDFTFNLERFSEIVKNYKLVSFVATSNLDGYTLPIKEIIKIAHENNVKVHLDGAQFVPHNEINVRKLDLDNLQNPYDFKFDIIILTHIIEHIPKDQKKESWITGIEHIKKQLDDFCGRQGLESFGKKGDEFDPEKHEALSQEENDKMEGKVIKVVKKGYIRGEKVIRPAQVVVGSKAKKK